jgi:hypothetical protein
MLELPQLTPQLTATGSAYANNISGQGLGGIWSNRYIKPYVMMMINKKTKNFLAGSKNVAVMTIPVRLTCVEQIVIAGADRKSS